MIKYGIYHGYVKLSEVSCQLYRCHGCFSFSGGQMWSDSSQIAMNERLQRHPVCKGCKSQKSWGLDSICKSIRFLLVPAFVGLQLFFYPLLLVANTQSLAGLWWRYIR